MEDFKRELEIRLKGKIEDSGVDDQLITNALEVTPAEYNRYMWKVLILMIDIYKIDSNLLMNKLITTRFNY